MSAGSYEAKDTNPWASKYRVHKFECCLPNAERILVVLAAIGDVDFSLSSFVSKLEEFNLGKTDIFEWELQGEESFLIKVTFEKPHTYSKIYIEGTKEKFEQARAYLLSSFYGEELED